MLQENDRWRDGGEGTKSRRGRHIGAQKKCCEEGGREGKDVCACLTGDGHCRVNQHSCMTNICQACRKGGNKLVSIVSIINTMSKRIESGLHVTIITADRTEDRTCTTSSKYGNLSPILSYDFLSRSVTSLVTSIKVEQGERLRGKSSDKVQSIMLSSTTHKITSKSLTSSRVVSAL